MSLTFKNGVTFDGVVEGVLGHTSLSVIVRLCKLKREQLGLPLEVCWAVVWIC